ncbi:hypothetical protein ABCS02_28120 [Microbacterium sp. X-17]|uniref:hypothetical protein n=1 Tax=Microbacterium sp. X-17 TaxID=3144404 RepID=UPI0031F48D2C
MDADHALAFVLNNSSAALLRAPPAAQHGKSVQGSPVRRLAGSLPLPVSPNDSTVANTISDVLKVTPGRGDRKSCRLKCFVFGIPIRETNQGHHPRSNAKEDSYQPA